MATGFAGFLRFEAVERILAKTGRILTKNNEKYPFDQQVDHNEKMEGGKKPMTSREFARYVAEFGDNKIRAVDEESAKEIAQLISGSLVYRLYEAICSNDYNPHAVTAHLEMLYDSGNHFGLVYYILMLAESSEVELPERFTEFAVTASHVPYLSAALIEDWLDYNEDFVL